MSEPGTNSNDTVTGRSASVSSISDEAMDVSYSATTVVSGEQEYETQFLGFCPKSFCDGLYNAVQHYAWEYFEASQKYMNAECSGSSELMSQEELHTASQVFLSTISKQIDRAFDKFEAYALTNILNIPSNVVLPEDKVKQEFMNFSKTEEQLLDDEIRSLKEKIISSKCFNASLKQEYEEIRQTQQQYTDFLETLRAMDTGMREAGVHDIHGSLKYTVEKSNKVLSLLNDMNKNTTNKRLFPQPDDGVLKKLKANDVLET